MVVYTSKKTILVRDQRVLVSVLPSMDKYNVDKREAQVFLQLPRNIL